MGLLEICLGAFALVLGGLVLLVVVLRLQAGAQRRALREAIVTYAAGRGGSAIFDADGKGFRVEGPRGAGHMSMTALEIMCRADNRATWDTSIGFSLRQYIPDAMDDALAASAAKRLAKLEPLVRAMSEDELRERLRVVIHSDRTGDAGLATCARPVGSRHEARVVLDGIDLSGLPHEDRQRLSESDEELFELGLAQTLPGDAPSDDAREAAGLAWLCRAAAIFGDAPHLIVASDQRLSWTAVEPGGVEARLVSLCRASSESGPLKNVLFAWDGSTLSSQTIVVHSIIGPNTPDYTLRVPPSFHGALGIQPGPDGSFGVRRSPR